MPPASAEKLSVLQKPTLAIDCYNNNSIVITVSIYISPWARVWITAVIVLIFSNRYSCCSLRQIYT